MKQIKESLHWAILIAIAYVVVQLINGASWSIVVSTAASAFVGGMAGWWFVELLSYVSKKILK